MAQEAWPYEGVAVNEERWRAMSRLWRRTGVVDGVDGELEVTAVTGQLQVSVAAGEAWIDGHYYANGAAETLSIATADLNDDRIDLVVVRSTAGSSAVLAVITGTPAATPAAPVPTQDHETAGVYEEPLAEVTVQAASGNVDGQVVDVRTFSLVPQDEGLPTVSATAPASPSVNEFWYDTANELLKRWDGDSWEADGNAAYAARDAVDFSDDAGTTYTLALADAGYVKRFTAAGAATVTVPTNAAVAFPTGSIVEVYAAGAGGVTVAGDTGVTVRNAGALAQFGSAVLTKHATDEWVMTGAQVVA